MQRGATDVKKSVSFGCGTYHLSEGKVLGLTTTYGKKITIFFLLLLDPEAFKARKNNKTVICSALSIGVER